MTGLVAIPAPTNPPPAAADQVAADGWWPVLSVAAFRDAMRIGTEISDGRTRNALIAAVLTIDGQLATWRTAQTAAGAADLAAVPGRSFAGETRPARLWRTAVYSTAAAELAETHVEVGASTEGRERREMRAASAADLLRAATLAIRQLTGGAPSRVRLL